MKSCPFHCLLFHTRTFQWEDDWPILWKNGRKLQTTNGSSLIIRHGFRIPFSKIPPLSSVPIRMSQSSSPFIREEIENLLNKRAVERVQNPGTLGFYSRTFLVPKKNRKLRLIIDLSLLNRFIKKQSFKMETVKSVRQAMRLNDWAVSIDLTDAYLHVPIHHQSQKYLRFIYEDQVYHFTALPFGMSLSPLIFSKLMDVIAAFLRQLAVSVFPYLDDWLIKNLIRNRLITQTRFCIQIIQSQVFCQISRNRISFLLRNHLYRHGISDATEFSQGSNGSCSEPISDNQEISVIQTCIGTNFPFLFGQTQCCSRLRYPRQTALMSPSDVSFVCLETSYSSSRSSCYDKRYDSISLTMVDKPQSVGNRDYYPSSRSQILPLYGCQSLRMGSSFRANNTILSWSLDRLPIPAPYQYVWNDGHTISTETSHNIYTPFLHHDIYRQHNGGLIYQQTGWHSFSQPLRRSLGNSELVPGTWHRYQSSSHSRQIQHSCRPPIKIRQTYQDRMGSGSNSSEFSIPDAQFSKCGLVCDSIQSHKLPLYVSSVQDNKALAIDALSMDWNHLYAYAFPPFILIPAVLEKIRQHQCRIVLIAPFWPQQQWFSELLLLVSAPIRLPLIPSLLTQSKGRFVHQNLPLLDLHAWELSNNQSEIKNFRKTLQILSLDQEEHLYKRSMMQNGPSSLIGVIQKG